MAAPGHSESARGSPIGPSGRSAKQSPLRYQLIDLAEINLPLLDEPLKAALLGYKPDHTKAWSELIGRFAGFVLVFPQYNWGYPGVLKNALEYLYYEWRVSSNRFGHRAGQSGAVAERRKWCLIWAALSRPAIEPPCVVRPGSSCREVIDPPDRPLKSPTGGTPMLTTTQLDHFATFGFVVLHDFLAEHTAPLRAEVETAIRDAYAATYHERVLDGISGHYLPMASRLTPTSTSLICDDPRFVEAAEDLLGGAVIPECPGRRRRRVGRKGLILYPASGIDR